MAFAAWLLNVPKTSQEWNVWSLANRLSHDAIRQAILAQKNVSTVDYLLEPMDFKEIKGWLQRNGQTHIEQTGAVGLQSHDIQEVDFNDEAAKVSWIQVHALEHFDLEQALGV